MTEWLRLIRYTVDHRGTFSRTAHNAQQRLTDYNRPHGGLGGQTLYERLRQKTTSPV